MWNITKFEISYLLRRPATYIYFFILFLFAFLFIATDIVQIGGGIGKVNLNSPFVLFQASMILTLVGTFITTAIAGTAIIRDFQIKTHELFYTKPITKAQYLCGRFIGVVAIMLFAYSGILFGLAFGELMPWVDAEQLGAFNFLTYWNSFLVFIFPNVLFISALFFAVGTLTRNIFLVYVQGIILIIAQTIAQTLTADLDNDRISSLIDPFGGEAFALVTKYWTVVEQNTLQLSFFDSYIFSNRILWIGISLALFAITYILFDFNVQPIGSRKVKKKNIQQEEKEDALSTYLSLPNVVTHFDFKARVSQYISLTKFYLKSIVTEIPFLAIGAIGILNFVMSAIYSDSIFGTSTWLVTHAMIEAISGFTLFLLILSTVYAGELINRERELKLDQTFDALNLPNSTTLLGKFTALIIAMSFLFLLLIPIGSVVQIAKGFTDIDFSVYLGGFLFLQLPNILNYCMIAFLIHTLINNKFIGHFAMVAFFILNEIVLNEIGFEHNLWEFGSSIGITYSDMNGWGPFLGAKLIWELHWFFVGGFLLFLSNLFWVRGTESSFKLRIKSISQRLNKSATAIGAVLLLASLITGSIIYYNTNVLNDYRNSDDTKDIRAQFEKTYKSYEDLNTPKIVDTYVEVDLYPSELAYHVKGRNILVNKTTSPIDSVWLNWEKDNQYSELGFNKAAKEVHRNETYDFSIYAFDKPLMPGDSIELAFDFDYKIEGFSNNGISTAIAGNGTFLNSNIFPSIGYNSGIELSADDDRKEQGLAEKERTASIYDTTAYANHGLGSQADWVNFETIVSTEVGQIAVAPGYLQSERTEGGRTYFHYKMDAPILYFFSFLSADYEVIEKYWNDVKMQIMYHSSHAYNTDRMMESLENSFEYFSEEFGEYQFKQIRILEFPRYAAFAQSFPNTVPFSEGIGFIARLKTNDDIDYPYYVTAHELAHQWFGHQVVGADVQGNTMLIETFAQYGALMVMKKEYGEDVMKKFLRYELNSYLQGRTSERKKELPLMLVENQQYLHYRKGSVVMYALQDYLGEELVNGVIKDFVQDNKFQEPPYTTTLDFVSRLKAAVPDSMLYLIEDMFETITLYENRANEATFTALSDSTWEVSLTINTKKLRADSLGLEQEIEFADYIDIGVFGEESETTGELGKRLYLTKHKISGGDETFTVIVNTKPVRAGVDPYNKLIDRNPDDNVKRVEEKN